MSKVLHILKKTDSIRGLQFFQLLRLSVIMLTGILFSKGHYTLEEIGIYESLMFVSTLFSFFWINGLLHSLLSTYRKRIEEGDESRILNTGIIIFLLNALLVTLMWLFHPLIQSLLPGQAGKYLPHLLIYILLNNPAFLVEYTLLLREKISSLMIYGLCMFVLHLILVAGPSLAGLDFENSLYGLIAIALLKNLILFGLFKNTKLSSLKTYKWGEIILTASPLILSFLISGSAEYIDGFLISTHFGSDIFALYRYGARELPLAVLLASSITSAIVPMLATPGRFEEGLAAIRKESARLMHILFPITILLVIGSAYFYPLIFRNEFVMSAGIFNIYLLLLISRVFFPQAVVMALGRNDIIFKVALAEISINIISSYLLMLEVGIEGVAWGTVIAFFSEKVMLYAFLYRNSGIKIHQLIPSGLWLFYSSLLIIIYLLYLSFISPGL